MREDIARMMMKINPASISDLQTSADAAFNNMCGDIAAAAGRPRRVTRVSDSNDCVRGTNQLLGKPSVQ